MAFGALLRDWRTRRHRSQLDLACDAEISTKHLSFLETGRSQPSRDMVLLLSEKLDVPLRERNALLHAAGFAPSYTERPLTDPALASARRAVELVLRGHEPYPALAVDRHWTLLAANEALAPLLAGVDAKLLAAPVNVLRLALHPHGLAPRIANHGEWRAHLLERLHHQVVATGDPVLVALESELRDYPAPSSEPHRLDEASVVVPMKLRTDEGVLSFFSTTTVFGTPLDITLSELALEAFYPADDFTAATLQRRR